MLLTPAQLLSPVDRLDWLMLSYARVAVRFGAQHSSYIKTATVAGCGVKIHESSSSWRFKSASTWLLGKVELALRGARRRNQTQESNAGIKRLVEEAMPAAQDWCNTSLGKMLVQTPCGTPCLLVCRATIHAAYT